MKIKNITAREILDSRGRPTVEAEVVLSDGIRALGQVPSGASTGASEALELRDKDLKRYSGEGVLKAVNIIKGQINKMLRNKDADNQEMVDKLMIEADGKENKSKYGANAILAVSMAICRAAARSRKIPLYNYLGGLCQNKEFKVPQPQILLLEGGKHGNWATDVQEFMIVPQKRRFKTFKRMLRTGVEVYSALEEILINNSYSTGVGFEGAFCPQEIKSNEEAFQLIKAAIIKAGYKVGDEIFLAIDAAASEFYSYLAPEGQTGCYILKSEAGKRLKPKQWIKRINKWLLKYSICSLEDIFAEEDWDSWTEFNLKSGRKVQLVGDDLLTTNVKRIQKAINLRAVNSVIIKPNQIGTITETLKAITMADTAGLTTIVSHRAGETNDDFLADLVVGTTSSQSKFGAPVRGERLAKYNRLLRIEEQLK